MESFLGIDVGSVTTKAAVLDSNYNVITSIYSRTQGKPVEVVKQVLREVGSRVSGTGVEIRAVGTTGSGRQLTGTMLGADVIKNEITAHAVAASHYVPDAQTIFEIGGQDSKIIILRDGVVVDFAMNTVCAAGTGSFLDQQSSRLNIKVEDFGELALKSAAAVRIAGRCTVFAESDMIHKQQMGHTVEDILYGLCEAMVRNYLNNIGLGKEILPPIIFQGGVAFNRGIIRAFEEALKTKIIVPPHHQIMGAIGAAMLAREQVEATGAPTKFKGFGAAELDYRTTSFECKACSNLCEIVQIRMNRKIVASWGGRCDMWDRVGTSAAVATA